MAVPKVLGTETEFGIHVRGEPGMHPSVSSALVVQALADRRERIGWSYDAETPRRDARGSAMVNDHYDADTTAANVVLTNGARFYVDHAHPEYSSPETLDPRDTALYDKAGEWVAAGAATRASVEAGREIALYKNNTDGKGASYGAHENVLLDRELGFGRVIAFLPTFLVTRQLITGSGKVGAEMGRPPADFQITQRADFIEEIVGLETTLRRPLVNTRDEPHADARYRRLHVIVADATMSEVQTWVKVGVLAAFLAAVEDDAIPDDLALADPVRAAWAVSRDLTGRIPLALADGRSAGPIELQWQYHEWISRHRGHDDDGLLAAWASLLADLERGPAAVADRLDWAAKLRLLDGYGARGVAWSDPRMAAVDLQFHALDPAKGLHARLVARGDIRRLFTDDEVAAAATAPPVDTRAYFRGRCVERFAGQIVAANWDSLVFDTGGELLQRLPMMDPLKGTRDLTGDLIDAADDAASLLEAIGAQR